MNLLTSLIISPALFTLTILALVVLLLIARSRLVQTGNVKISINNDDSLTKSVAAGSTLLSSLSDVGIYLPSACGGGGTCGMCTCQVLEGGGDLLPTETGHITRKMGKEHWRLGCQVKIKEDLKLLIPDEIFNIKKYDCTVRSNQNVATFITELILDLPEGETLKFKSGGYIQIDIPQYDEISFRDFTIGDEYKPSWDHFKFWDIKGQNPEPIFRAYSMANHPAEGNRVMLNVRIATPPFKTDFPPGISSTYIFSLKSGDKVTVSGPYGEFFARDTDNEMCFIGGGAGMAPMRSHIYHQLLTEKTKRKITFWYGARSRCEMFYHDEYLKLEQDNPDFKYTVALSEPQKEDKWDGAEGFIHSVVHDLYLKEHEDPTEIEYYLCGPPLMLSAVQKMLHDLGVEKEMVMFDEF